jgi:hypothetical protein
MLRSEMLTQRSSMEEGERPHSAEGRPSTSEERLASVSESAGIAESAVSRYLRLEWNPPVQRPTTEAAHPTSAEQLPTSKDERLAPVKGPPTEMQILLMIPWSSEKDGKRRCTVWVWSGESPNRTYAASGKEIELPEDDTLLQWLHLTYPSVINVRVDIVSADTRKVGELWYDLVNALATIWPLKDLCDFGLRVNGKTSGSEFDEVMKEFRAFPNEQYDGTILTGFDRTWGSLWPTRVCACLHVSLVGTATNHSALGVLASS